MSKEKVAERLKELRLSKRLGCYAISEMIGMNPKAWGLWERGHYLPSSEALLEIADVFEVSADWVLGLSDKRSITR